MKNKILLLFPDGVGIRNYLYTNVFDGSEKNVALLHAFDAKTIRSIQEITKIEEVIQIPKYKESIKEKFFRELICLSRLRHNSKLVNNPTLLTNWKTNHSTFQNKLFYKAVEFFAKGIRNYQQILNLEENYQKSIRTNSFYKEIKIILELVKPAQIFCSHQRGLQCATIFAVATDMGIKTTTVIYSWDNLPKARMALKADQYLVWSDYMKEELHLYYPEILTNQIFITGTPQFECYQNSKNIIPKAEFYSTYNLDKNRKIICFSGDDIKTSPDDPKYLEDLASELVKSDLSKEYQILLRRCPVDISGRFDAIISRYSDLIKQAPPLWHYQADSSWSTIYPLPEDVPLLVSTAFYSDVVVNVGSTMAFDFAMFEKPCIYINYDQLRKTNTDWSIKAIYQFQHFRSMPEKSCVLWWNKKEDISMILYKLEFSPTMTTWTTIILSDYKRASDKIKQLINFF